jgi:hypothetical protein
MAKLTFYVSKIEGSQWWLTKVCRQQAADFFGRSWNNSNTAVFATT